MVFDSHYDDYRGAITYVRVMNGTVKRGSRSVSSATTPRTKWWSWAVHPQAKPCDSLQAGQVGYLICNIKSLSMIHIGDTITIPGDKGADQLPGYKEPKRMVYCGLYPSDGQDFTELRDALEKLSINDPSFEFEAETSDALGFGFRCGFLGLLHMEIVQQRLEGEADVDLVQTAPNVTYEIVKRGGEVIQVHKPQDVPDSGQIEEFRQPIVRVNLSARRLHWSGEKLARTVAACWCGRNISPPADDARLRHRPGRSHLRPARQAQIRHPRLRDDGLRAGRLSAADLVRMDIMVNGNRVDALAIICHRSDADRRGRAVCQKLKEEIDRHMFEVAIQAAIGTRIISRETKPAMKKNVTAKCYGGDITRKRKAVENRRKAKSE
jgi:GTP-binding protein LepA